jgi:hypothetical protein
MNNHDLSRIAWRKSSYSNGQGGACIEVAPLPHAVAVRDSKQPHATSLTFTAGAWHMFTKSLR